ncbi:MAG: MogA/MoaB family molybdenum cofactor biosynthesis protein [Bacillota bacterium]|nr:MogA/MoaB family molybdenum cofactor biosynthesis protein [Bacillota bacterium]
MSYTAIVITISDRSFKGVRKDSSGPALCEMLKENNFEIIGTKLIPDDPDDIKNTLIWACDTAKADLVLTTGGTGFGTRDNTPEATKAVIEKECPGIPEAMRAESFKITPYACLSRETAGIRKQSLIINCPGSEKAAKENFGAVIKAVIHGLAMVHNIDHENLKMG